MKFIHSSFLEELSYFCGWGNQASCSFNSGKLGCEAYFTTTLSACGNAAARSCDECLLVLTDTALLVLRLPFVPFLDTRKGNVTEQNCSVAPPCFSYPASAAPAVGYPWSATLWELPKVCALPRSGSCPWFINVLPSEVAGTDWSTETCQE